MKVVFLLFAATLQLSVSTSTLAFEESEMQVRNRIQSAVTKAFLMKDYDLLEKLAQEYRSTKDRTPSGLWKLTLFYSGIQGAVALDTRKDPAKFGAVEDIASGWVAKYPKSPAALIVKSSVHLSHGAAIRGSGYANTVKAEAWTSFYEYVTLARLNLEVHKTTAHVDPQWYEQMIAIARLEGWSQNQFKSLFVEGTAREPLYYQTYFSALEYLLPKWGGSTSEIEKFAVEATKNTSVSEGVGMYARIYWYASQTQFKDDIFGNSKVDWLVMKKGFDDVLSKYPDAWNLVNFTKFACLAKDGKKANELLGRIEKERIAPGWATAELIQKCQILADLHKTK